MNPPRIGTLPAGPRDAISDAINGNIARYGVTPVPVPIST